MIPATDSQATYELYNPPQPLAFAASFDKLRTRKGRRRFRLAGRRMRDSAGKT